MSVTFHLFKPMKEIKFLGSHYDFSTKKEKEEISNKNYIDDNFFEDKFSDNKKHNIIDLSYYYAICRQSKKTRLFKQLNNLENKFNCQLLETKNGWTYKTIVVDEIKYYQGWFLRKKFFKKNMTIYFATTKSQMIHFFKQYMDYKNPRAIECMQLFLKSWEDGIIFKVSW